MIDNDYCFCSLALGKEYVSLAQDLADSMKKYTPGKELILFTDKASYFREYSNVKAYSFAKKGVKVFNDKRFVIQKAIEKHKTAIFVDADSLLVNMFPEELSFSPGIMGRTENLLEHVDKYCSERMWMFEKLAKKLEVDLHRVKWIGESRFAVTRDDGKYKDFLNLWGDIAKYAELCGFSSGEGSYVGIAAEKAGMVIYEKNNYLEEDTIKHLDYGRNRQWSKAERFIEKKVYRMRLIVAKIKALGRFNFFIDNKLFMK